MAKPKPNLNPNFLELSKLLNAHSVRYLLIGGYAVGYHGWARNTKDIDFWIASDPGNQKRVIAALREFAFPSAEDNILAEDDAMLRFGVPPFRVEFLKKISGVSFEDAWPNRVLWDDGEIQIPVIGIEDLRRNKAASGRPQDLADLKALPQK
jgi:hypothetical protein